jgi:hypothetical protein
MNDKDNRGQEGLKVEKLKKTHKSKVQKETYTEETLPRRLRRQMPSGKFFFYYEKEEGRNAPHDFRLQLKKMITARYKDKTPDDIPKEFELALKFGTKFLICFENKEEVAPTDTLTLRKFEWCRGIEENEFGIVDND